MNEIGKEAIAGVLNPAKVAEKMTALFGGNKQLGKIAGSFLTFWSEISGESLLDPTVRWVDQNPEKWGSFRSKMLEIAVSGPHDAGVSASPTGEITELAPPTQE